MTNPNSNQCAVNTDGSLKDASEIDFYDSEGDEQPSNTRFGNNTGSSKPPLDIRAALTASGAVPAPKVGGSRIRKPAWKLTTTDNVASTSKTSGKRKQDETSTAPTTKTKKPRRPQVISDDDSEDDESTVSGQAREQATSNNRASVQKMTGDHNNEDEEVEADYNEIQEQRRQDGKVCCPRIPLSASNSLTIPFLSPCIT
ncbi:hypothetical protein BJ138DRAFT_1120054 [Hygrophoropsis aurantiaca]|uniref:Uncharacterized protein n=1 Tax=Hygrophoropsis aurantiaca TaxID=72124 RepID=A0ACB7ZSV9_9AGAM|nr:hypothetical protein BJ138DRAFT_1120054 [Hygrophoropsis aurantiaca]